MSRKRFQFSLEKVLHLREHETRRAEQKFSEVLRHRRAKEEELAVLRSALEEAGLMRPSSGQVTSRSLQLVEARREEVERQIRRTAGQLTVITERAEKLRDQLRRRKMDQESLETLRDKQFERHRAEAKSAETAQIDEQAITAYNRK